MRRQVNKTFQKIDAKKSNLHAMTAQLRLLFWRFSGIMLIATLCRVVFWVFTPQMHGYTFMQLLGAFGYGLLYDLSANVYLHGLFILLHLLPATWFYKRVIQQFLLVLTLLVQLLQIFFNMVDTGYFTFSGRRSGIEIFQMRKETEGLVGSYLSDYWYLLLLIILLLALQWWLYHRTMPSNSEHQKPTYGKWWWELSARLLVATLAFLGARGGWQLLPLNTFDAARQTDATMVPLVVNTPFTMLMSLQQQGVQETTYFESKEADQWFSPYHSMEATGEKRNVVVLIVESLGKEYIGGYNGGKGYTPFLDSLMRHSEVYLHAYANGKKSIEGIPSILSSIPGWMSTPYLGSYYQSNRISSIGERLQQEGYQSAFFHGGKNGTMSLDNYVAISGGGKYYGKNEYPYPGDDDGHWGIFDKPFLNWTLEQFGQNKQSFFGAVFTLSSHHPYHLPENLKGKYPKGTLPIHACIGYADDALRDFFARASAMPFFANTTFIITADHSAENERPYYQSAQGKFEVPLIVYRPDDALAEKQNLQTVSHLDIQTIALQESKAFAGNYFGFGSLNSNLLSFPMAIQYHDGFYQAIHYPWVYHFSGDQALGLYQVERDSLLKHNLLGGAAVKLVQDSMDHVLKATLQCYGQALIKNKTFPE